MPIPLQALYYLSQQIAKRFVEILSKTVGWCVIHGRLVLLELKLLALGHQSIVEWLTVIRDDIARDTIPIDQVSLDEVHHIFLFYFLKRYNFCPFRKIFGRS